MILLHDNQACPAPGIHISDDLKNLDDLGLHDHQLRLKSISLVQIIFVCSNRKEFESTGERETPFRPILDKLTAKSWFFTNFKWKHDNGIEEKLLFQPMVAFN